jgi:hypothetical protein
MNTATIQISGTSPYSQSKYIDPEAHPANGKETKDAFEKRTWRHRVHRGKGDVSYIPPMAMKKSLTAAAPYLGKIPGQGNATYTKRFRSGLLIVDEIPLLHPNGERVKFDDWEGEWLFLDANGKPGGTRVKRCMPCVRDWSATVRIYVADEVIDEDVLRRVLVDAGRLVGVGRFRPENGGFYGRFEVDSIEWVGE